MPRMELTEWSQCGSATQAGLGFGKKMSARGQNAEKGPVEMKINYSSVDHRKRSS